MENLYAMCEAVETLGLYLRVAEDMVCGIKFGWIALQTHGMKGCRWETGRLGVMVTGGVQEDVLPLNEETVWYGGPRERTNPDAAQWLEPLRALLQRGEVERAEFFSRMAFSSCPKYLMPYLPLGNLRLTFPHHADLCAIPPGNSTIDNALAARFAIKAGGVFFEREFIIAKEPNVIAIHFRASEPKRLTFLRAFGTPPL